jgi:hypothetical protein
MDTNPLPTYAGLRAHPLLLLRPLRDARVVAVEAALSGHLAPELAPPGALAVCQELGAREAAGQPWDVLTIRGALRRVVGHRVPLSAVMAARWAWLGGAS